MQKNPNFLFIFKNNFKCSTGHWKMVRGSTSRLFLVYDSITSIMSFVFGLSSLPSV